MSDLIYVALVVAFFAVAAGLVRACEAVIGPDEPTRTEPTASEPTAAAGVR